jgi:hypothetical protein
MRLSPLGTSATNCPIELIDEYWAFGGMRIGKGNRSTRRKPTPVPLYPPQIPHDLTWDRSQTAAVGSQRLTAWAMARPTLMIIMTTIGWLFDQDWHFSYGLLVNTNASVENDAYTFRVDLEMKAANFSDTLVNNCQAISPWHPKVSLGLNIMTSGIAWYNCWLIM